MPLYWRLSSIYFFYFAVIGAMAPYWGLYLQDLGFSAVEIGLLAALPLLVRLFIPLLWAYVADKSSQRLLVLRLGILGSFAFYGALIFVEVFYWIALFLAMYSLFWNAILAQTESITLKALAERYAQYGRIRLWGSVGFIVSVFGLGLIFDLISIQYLPMLVSLLILGLLLMSFSLPKQEQLKPLKGAEVGLLAFIKNKEIIVFLLVSFLLQLSHGPYYTFFSIHLENFAYTRLEIGFLWMVGVAAEVLIFVFLPQMMRSASLFVMLVISLLLTMLRWLGIALFVDHTAILIVIQLLHAFSFGVNHAIAIEFCRRRFGERMQSRGQALYSSVSFGGGAAAGAGLSGILWEFGASQLFVLSACTALIALILTVIFLRRFDAVNHIS